jgi:type VI secretion system Hcp family effector
MAFQFYIEVKGKTQGQIKGGTTKSQNSKIHGIQQGLTALTPANLPHTIRKHGDPLVITAESEPPALHSFNPLQNNLCAEICIKLVKLNAHVTLPSFTITLTNATVTLNRINPQTHTENHVENNTYELTEFKFTFQKIVVENVAGSTSASDDWTSQS